MIDPSLLIGINAAARRHTVSSRSIRAAMERAELTRIETADGSPMLDVREVDRVAQARGWGTARGPGRPRKVVEAA